jgi:hypothetical protein
MSDEKASDSADQSTDAPPADAQEAVEIDPRPRVGIGGGTDSFHHRVDKLEER